MFKTKTIQSIVCFTKKNKENPGKQELCRPDAVATAWLEKHPLWKPKNKPIRPTQKLKHLSQEGNVHGSARIRKIRKLITESRV